MRHDRRVEWMGAPQLWGSSPPGPRHTKLLVEFETQCDAVRPRCIVVCPRPTANRLRFRWARRKETLDALPLPVVHLTSRFSLRPLFASAPPFLASRQGVGAASGFALRWSLQSTGPDTLLAWGVSEPRRCRRFIAVVAGFRRATTACLCGAAFARPAAVLTRRRTGDRGPGGDGRFAIRQHPRQTAAPERPHDPWPGLIRPSRDVVEWWVGRGCRDPVQINNWISETDSQIMRYRGFSELHGPEIASWCFA